MSRGVKFFGVLLGVPAVLLALFYINTYVYPFQSKKPNFSDVEQAFAKLQFPADWQEIQSSENRGIAGRNCDMFDSSGCFHKGKIFKMIEIVDTKEKAKEMFLKYGGCSGVMEESFIEGNSSTDPRTGIHISCQVSGGVMYHASISQKRGEININAATY